MAVAVTRVAKLRIQLALLGSGSRVGSGSGVGRAAAEASLMIP